MASVHSWLLDISRCFQVLTALLLCLLLMTRVGAQNGNGEVRTLLSFKKANFYALPALNRGYFNTWNGSDENPCTWLGVTCTPSQTVYELDLSGWGFDSLNLEALSNLAVLRRLDLSSNNLRVIPEVIGSLTGLTRLDLSRNNLQGNIPLGIAACQDLRYISLQENQLSGDIVSLRGLRKLQYLLLARNQLSGPFPKELGEVSSLTILDLCYNSLSGTIPALPNLTNLVDLRLDNNNFTEFEQNWFIGANSIISYLSISFNQLKGVIPSGMTNLPHLEVLNLSHNHLSGDIPYGFSRQVGKNFSLDFSQNDLTGKIPADMLQQQYNASGGCAFLNLSHNLLDGSVPIDGANYSCFHVLDLSYNNLSGPIPSNIFSEDGGVITKLWLQNNHLSGDIVDVLVDGPGFQNTAELQLQNNTVTGDLSRIVNSNLRAGNLRVLDISNNDLGWSASQAIPDPVKATLERLTSGGTLTEFRVGGNNFSGTSLPTACFVNQSNQSAVEYLQALDLSNNRLNGKISGKAFSSLCLPRLQFLNISNNEVSGPVPESIVRLPGLKVLDVSNNDLSGPLPVIPLTNSLILSSFFGGNAGLCGYPLSACPSQIPGIEWWVLFIIVGVSLTIAIGSCVVVMWQWRVYLSRHQQDADLIKTLMERDSATLMSLRELKKATNSFAASAQVGEGGFGIVYKGKLSNGTIVAIKRSKCEGSEKDKERFLNEVTILSQVNHRNLVKLLGCCMENKIALLVFEFVSNGTLQEHLQGKLGVGRLSWKQRLNIAVQSADALNYLHSATMFPIYHRDVKSANILLDDDLNAKVGDLGISRLAPMKATHVSTIGMGTMGYIDPEYWTSFKLTDKSDVYSFGVVLLELISAQPAINFRRDEEEKSLVVFANSFIQSGDFQGLLDPSLMEIFNDPTSQARGSILNVGRLAMKCVEMRSKARPSMNEVLKELQNLWLELNGTSTNLDSINKDDREDKQHDHTILLFDSFSSDSTSFTMQGDAIQMSQFT